MPLLVFALGDARASLALQGGFGIAVMSAETKGITSGRRVSGSETMFGPRLGIEARWEPSVRVPVALHLGATRSWWGRFGSDGSVDGFSPFNGREVSLNSAQLGVAVRLPKRRAS